jgi:tetratricopeptide (TPR) repeat protein
MRYALFVLTTTLLAAAVTAQDVPQGPSPLAVGTYGTTNTALKTAAQDLPQGASPLVIAPDERATNTAAQAWPGTQNLPQGATPLITDAYEKTTNVAAQTESTNLVKTARTAFLLNIGVQYADEGEYKEAEQAYLRALESDPGNPDTRFRLSTLYIQMERYAEAAGLLNKLAEEFPDNPMLHNNLSWVYSTGGKVKNGKLALRHAREAVMISPYSASLWNTLAEAYYVFGQYDNARRTSEHALELLRLQNASKDEIAAFEAQRAKIQRANEAYKMLLGLDAEK